MRAVISSNLRESIRRKSYDRSRFAHSNVSAYTRKCDGRSGPVTGSRAGSGVHPCMHGADCTQMAEDGFGP